MTQRFSRLLAIVMLVASAGAMMATSFDAEARRMGGGKSFGRQSTNITQQRQAVTPPKAAAPAASTATAGAATAGAATAGMAAKTGMSRWLGPLAGIAAGLGIAALLSQLGLSGAFLEMISSLVLIGLLAAAIMYIVRRLRGVSPGSRMQQAGAGGSMPPGRSAGSANAWRQPGQTMSSMAASSLPGAAATPAAPLDEQWFIPGDFDTPAFLSNAKAQFVAIQAVWDSGQLDKLHEFLTDDLIAELKPQLLEQQTQTCTEVVLLNAELLGIEAVSGGHLASVRYSGMLRESKDAEAFRFEEVWNLYKADQAGWLLAGIQQVPVALAG
jgi:predicted lipid-binding transport protein (Tim44 family)